jgi:hypothetical protein
MRIHVISGLVLLLALVSGCSENDSGIEYTLADTRLPTDQVRYLVEGGGDIDFRIRPVSGFYMVQVLRYDFTSVDEELPISEAELDADDSYLLTSLFQGTVNIGGTILSSEAETGSWTYVYVNRNGAWLRVASQDVIDGLRSVHDKVRSRLPGGKTLGE